MHLVSDNTPKGRPDRFLRLQEVEHITGLKKSTIYRLMREKDTEGNALFPPGVKVTPRCTAWAASQVQQWVQDRIASATSRSAA